MRIKRRVTFRSEEKKIIKFLEQQEIIIDSLSGISAIEIYEDDKNFDTVARFLALNNIKIWQSNAQCIYTKKELDEAKWLTVRSMWYNGYPQPEDNSGYIHQTFDASNFCEKCDKGLVQKDSFLFKKSPKWGQRHFMMLNWVHDELFISQTAMDTFIANEVRGVDYYKVLTKSKKEIDGVMQLFIKNYLPGGLKSESFEYEIICGQCNYKKYFPKVGFTYYSMDSFKNVNVDVIKSSEKFGEITCTSLIFVTQRFRQVIMQNNLARNLVFEPVQLV